MDTRTVPDDDSRRRFLRGVGTLAAGASLTGTAATAAGQDESGLAGWFEGVENFEGLLDARGESEVAISVGAPGNGGAFAFEPAAVRVDPGTTVVWEWTGKGGMHNVVDTAGAYESDLVTDASTTFEHAFEADGVSTYVCAPHEQMGMKGAVVVGGAPVDIGTAGLVEVEPDYGDWFDGVENYEGTVDMRGKEAATIAVGAGGNGGNYAFEPAAVRIDPGTTVVWEWTGEGGVHDVRDADETYASDATDEAGATYSLTFDGDGISKYACPGHSAHNMRGAIVVGNPEAGIIEVGTPALVTGGLLTAAALSPVALLALLIARGDRDRQGKVYAPGGVVPEKRSRRKR
ncbi:halocyanin domain-containing protein [Haloarchaeobius amylolyticus]|uniref:halocyanin domain-containing protein n=1 Tax=Haloarchaeobius amylolyticus TaxID=1198296 RepID=UPI002270813A|nr:halocyanin domain-containing protein [Haloarchaeobius amylolyticus]